MSLRRSARAPTTQPAPDGRQHINSSASSVSSGRIDRSSRSSQKPLSPQPSPPPRSQTPENAENLIPLPPRRTRSNAEDQQENDPKNAENRKERLKEDNEEDEEEETRCVCGQLEYPGLPVTSKNNSKARLQSDSDPISEDSTGWFIQCDSCQVWQHGGCVGILDENDSPEKYYCELCRKDLHEVGQDLNGRKHSRYLPAQSTHSSSASPPPKGKESGKRTRESRPSRTELDNLAKGRRATMNSRDSAYDEAEQLRRAIEESKKDSAARPTSARKGKRGRSESEERDEEAKRRRTTSGSSSSNHGKQQQQQIPGSDEEPLKFDKNKNIRGAAARNHRAKDLREREAREKERGDAAKRRVQNSKRKADEADVLAESTSRSASTKGANLPSKISQNLPSKSHKKGGRPPARKGRLGRNQYSKDRDPPNHIILSPGSNNSHDGDVGHTNGGLHNYGLSETNGLGKPSRPRHMNPNRTTMNDMKRRVAGILEFISHTQVEMAGLDAAKSRTSSIKSSNNMRTSSQGSVNEVDKAGLVLPRDIHGMLTSLGEAEMVDEEAFGKLNAVEMMEVLTRRLMRWQSSYGKYGEK